MLPVKNNLAADVAAGMSFTIEPCGPNGLPVVCWDPEPVTISADEALEPEHKRRGPSADAREEAEKFLREALADGPRPAKDVIDEGDQCGFSKRTVQRAFQGIGGQREKRGFSDGWLWALPEGATSSTAEKLGTFGETWHLRTNPEENGTCGDTPYCEDPEGAKFFATGAKRCRAGGDRPHVTDAIAGRFIPSERMRGTECYE
jgi:hypothetical protein